MQLDYRYVLLLVIIVVIIWYLVSRNSKPDIRIYQDQGTFDGDYRIIVNDSLYEKFVDILLDFTNKTDDKKLRTLYIYMATFQIFNLNFHHKRLEKLDQNLAGIKMFKDDIAYPSWTKYHNIQAAIANLVGKELTDTDRDFTGNAKEDRKMVDVYLSTMFDLFGIVRVRD